MAVAETSVGAEAVGLLSELIRFDTVNPPGNEGPAQDMLAARLDEAGFDCSLLAAEDGRPNLVARLSGDAPGETLCLLGHVDTVPADASEWDFDPWSGDVLDGQVRGRGAQDMKGQVAAEVAAAVGLARQGWNPARGELKLVLTADEEMGAGAGARWLCENHPDAVRADLVVNEGGGASFELVGRRFYTLCVGEKGANRFVLRARGAAGHASVPALGDNALLRLAPALARFREQPPLEPTAEGIAFLEALLGEPVAADRMEVEAAVQRLRTISAPLAAFLAEPMMRVTMVPTRVRASEKNNVIPSTAEVLVDCRVPPGSGRAAASKRLADLLGSLGDELEVEFMDETVGNRSPWTRRWPMRSAPG